MLTLAEYRYECGISSIRYSPLIQNAIHLENIKQNAYVKSYVKSYAYHDIIHQFLTLCY